MPNWRQSDYQTEGHRRSRPHSKLRRTPREKTRHCDCATCMGWERNGTRLQNYSCVCFVVDRPWIRCGEGSGHFTSLGEQQQMEQNRTLSIGHPPHVSTNLDSLLLIDASRRFREATTALWSVEISRLLHAATGYQFICTCPVNIQKVFYTN
jgi:hypothetical protein